MYAVHTFGDNSGDIPSFFFPVVGFFFSPLASLIPAYATDPALIVVGAMMMKNVQGIDFTDFSESIPAFLTVIMMPMTYSIGNGFGFGFASYCLLKLITGKYRQVTPVMWGVSIILIIGFFMHQ